MHTYEFGLMTRAPAYLFICHVPSHVERGGKGDLVLQLDAQLGSEREPFEVNSENTRRTMDREDLLGGTLPLTPVNRLLMPLFVARDDNLLVTEV